METKTDNPTEELPPIKAENTGDSEEIGSDTDRVTRTLVAIGDLHGDYFRMLRLLRENDLILPGTTVWNPDKKRVDLVLIGDYVDWRNEPLEGPQEQWVEGARRIIELLFSLHHQLEKLRSNDDAFKSHIYALLGNHDEMMIEAHTLFDFMGLDKLEEFLQSVEGNIQVRTAIQGLGLGPGEVEKVLKFLNWYVQGGRATIEGYKGIREWKEAMDTDMGDFLRTYLRLGVVVNNRLFAHTAPDPRQFWLPINDIMELPESTYRQAKEAFLWSRKVWGYDYCTGSRTVPFTAEEMDEMLENMGVEGVVVGHTPLPHDGKPVVAYDGRVINIDLHAFPGSEAYIETYVPNGDNRDPLRDPSLGR